MFCFYLKVPENFMGFIFKEDSRFMDIRFAKNGKIPVSCIIVILHKNWTGLEK